MSTANAIILALTRDPTIKLLIRALRVLRIGIVALARKLMISLWKYLETGAIPEGAVLKTRLI